MRETLSRRHIVAMCLNVIRVSVESENFAHVQNYVQKASQVPDLNEPVVLGEDEMGEEKEGRGKRGGLYE